MWNLSGVVDRYFIKQPRLRRLVTRAVAGDRVVTAELFGAALTVHTVKENGYLRAGRAAGRYSVYRDEAAVLLNLALLLDDGDAFVDIGANVGLFSCTLARRSRARPGRNRFVAFEANPDTVARLRAGAGPLGVEVHHCAVSDTAGALEFVAGAVSHVFTTVEHASRYNIPSERVSVPCRRLDEFDLGGGPVVLKIDVEGQERAVLDGAGGLFDAGRVKAVYLDGFADPGIPDLLRRRGFALHDGRTLLPTDGRVFSLLALRPAAG